jgi:hypothetical protein
MLASSRSEPRLTFLAPSWCQALLVGAALLALLAAFDLASPSNALRVWYWMKVVAPRQEARFGFKADLGADSYCLQVTSVAPGGAFARAGVQPGFMPFQPSCFGIPSAELFFSSLRAARDTPIRLTFIPAGCTRQPCNLRGNPLSASMSPFRLRRLPANTLLQRTRYR